MFLSPFAPLAFPFPEHCDLFACSCPLLLPLLFRFRNTATSLHVPVLFCSPCFSVSGTLRPLFMFLSPFAPLAFPFPEHCDLFACSCPLLLPLLFRFRFCCCDVGAGGVA